MVSRKKVAVFSAIFLATSIAILSGCSSGPGSDGLEQKSSVSLQLSWPEGYSFDSSTSQLNFISSQAMRAAPSYVTSCKVTISGEDMSSVTLDVPLSTGQVSGSATPGVRRFNVTVNTDIGVTFTGSTSATLVSGDNGGISIQMAVNAPPTVTISVSNASPMPGEVVTVSVSVNDLDAGDTHTFTWSAGGGDLGGSGPSATWVSYLTGSYTVSVTVEDSMGGLATASVAITMANTPPVITSITEIQSPDTTIDNILLSCSAEDDDGDALTYTWTDGMGWSANGADVSYLPVTTTDSITFTCTVSDGKPDGKVSAQVTSVPPPIADLGGVVSGS